MKDQVYVRLDQDKLIRRLATKILPLVGVVVAYDKSLAFIRLENQFMRNEIT